MQNEIGFQSSSGLNLGGQVWVRIYSGEFWRGEGPSFGSTRESMPWSASPPEDFLLVDAESNCRGTDHLLWFEDEAHKIYWCGLFYTAGSPAGLASITKLATDLRSNSLQQLAARFRGVFMLLVEDKRSSTRYVLVDNTGMFHVFCSGSGIATSFLELAALQGSRSYDLDPDAVVEFLHFGYTAFGRTLLKNIVKLPGEEIACVSRAGISFIQKALPSFESLPTQSLEDVLRDFTSSVAAERVSVDLTGGMDTRALVCILHYVGLNFDVAVRGEDANPDVQIARAVADAIGKPLHVCHTSVDDLESQLPTVLNICDGLLDVTKAHSALQVQRERVQRGITLMLSGNGGELYRDDWWLQDFPFYARKKANIERFCAYRLSHKDPDHSFLAGNYRQISQGYRQRLMQDLTRYEVRGNTQSYDRLVIHFRIRDLIGRLVTNHTHLLRCYVPFVERDALIFGYNLPRTRRFFDYYFRETATKCAPRAARLPTTRGHVSMSAEWPMMTKDFYKYCDDKLTRVKRSLEQKYLKRYYRSRGKLDVALEPPKLFSMLRRYEPVNRAVARLKDAGILNRDVNTDGLKNEYLGTVLTLGLVMDRLDAA